MAILENLCRMDLSIENIFARKDIWEKGTEHNYSVSGRNQNLIHIITNGTRIYDTDRGSFSLGSGTLILIPDKANYRTVTDTVCGGIGICFDLYSHGSKALIEPDVYCGWNDSGGRYHSLISEINDELEAGNNLLHIKAMMWKLIDSMISEYNGHAENDPVIAIAMEYIRDNYARNIPVSEYAAVCHLSESHFRRRFRAAAGVSPIEFRDSIRFEETKRMITRGMPADEASEKNGFCDAGYMRKLYRKRTGKSFNSDMRNDIV